MRALLRRVFCAEPELLDAYPDGRPPELASPRARLCAAGVDVALMVSALFWVGALGHEPAFGGTGGLLRFLARSAAWTAVLGLPVLLEGACGQTFGKRLAGIRVVTQDTGGPIGYFAAAHRGGARALFWFVSFLALADPLLRTLHDRSAGTVVVNDRLASARDEPGSESLAYERTDEA